MVKGHIQIKLKDEITGKVETHDQDNMVTDAAAYILGLLANMAAKNNNSIMGEALPVAKKALGGIFLFDGALEENAQNVHFPMNVHLTGHAGQDANTENKMAGSINSAESGPTDTGFTTVWDFSTSQANGTIAALALTSYRAGANPFTRGQYNSSTYQVDRRYYGVGFDENKQVEYLYAYEKGKIYKKQSFGAIITAGSPHLGSEEEVFDFAFTDPSVNSWSVVNGYDGYVYAINMKSLSSKGTVNVRIRKVKIDDGSFKEEAEQTFPVANVTSSGSSRISNYGNAYTVICRGYLYFVSYDNTTIYQVNLANTVDVKEFKFGEKKVPYIFPAYNGGLVGLFSWSIKTSTGASQTIYTPGYIYPDGKYCCREESTGSSSDLYDYISYETDQLKRIMSCTSNGNYMYLALASNYLGTICNLSSPVIKTSAQSMKITYTLTDV